MKRSPLSFTRMIESSFQKLISPEAEAPRLGSEQGDLERGRVLTGEREDSGED